MFSTSRVFNSESLSAPYPHHPSSHIFESASERSYVIPTVLTDTYPIIGSYPRPEPTRERLFINIARCVGLWPFPSCLRPHPRFFVVGSAYWHQGSGMVYPTYPNNRPGVYCFVCGVCSTSSLVWGIWGGSLVDGSFITIGKSLYHSSTAYYAVLCLDRFINLIVDSTMQLLPRYQSPV